MSEMNFKRNRTISLFHYFSVIVRLCHYSSLNMLRLKFSLKTVHLKTAELQRLAQADCFQFDIVVSCPFEWEIHSVMSNGSNTGTFSSHTGR